MRFAGEWVFVEPPGFVQVRGLTNFRGLRPGCSGSEEVYRCVRSGGGFLRGAELVYGEVFGGSEEVESDAVLLRFDGLFDLLPEAFELRGAEFAFEEGVLDVLQIFAPDLQHLVHSLHIHVVDHEDEHFMGAFLPAAHERGVRLVADEVLLDLV